MALSRSEAAAIAVLAKRRHDGLLLFRPMPPSTESPQEDVLRCDASEQLSRGGNRSGKTTVCAAKVAAIARGLPIATHSGEQIECRRPHQRKKTLEIWIIGYDWEHIGHTIYKLLFEPKAFKIIRDKVTGQWRAWKPWEPADAAREDDAVYAPPLIPMSEVKEIAWENKANRAFRRVELKNGNVIYGFASTGEVKAGDAVDIIWIDEKIQFPAYVAEWQARLVDHKGTLLWSSWPSMDNASLREMSKRALQHKQDFASGKRLTKPSTVEFRSKLSKNPYIEAKEIQDLRDRWGAKEAAARDDGEFVADGIPIYPGFRRDVHCAYGATTSSGHVVADDKIAQILRDRDGIPPADWGCDLIVDPGTAKPAVLAVARPPVELWGGYSSPPMVVFGEIYGKPGNAEQTAIAVKEMFGERVWHRWIIDWRAARQKPPGFPKTIGMHYSEAFEAQGLWCMESNVSFTPGSDHFPTRSMEVEKLMNLRGDGWPRLRIVIHRCPQLCLQLEENTKKMMNEVADERPANGQYDDLRCCLEYAASRTQVYVKPIRRHVKNHFEMVYDELDRIFGVHKKPAEVVHFGRAIS